MGARFALLCGVLLALVGVATGAGRALPPPGLVGYTTVRVEENGSQAQLHHLGRAISAPIERDGWRFVGWALGGERRVYSRPTADGTDLLLTDALGTVTAQVHLPLPPYQDAYYQLYDAPSGEHTLLTTVVNEVEGCSSRVYALVLTDGGTTEHGGPPLCARQTGYHWSGDGQRLARTYEKDAFRTQGVFLVNTDTGTSEDINLTGRIGRLFTGTGAWSPGGQSFAFVAEAVTRDGLGLYVLSLDGGLQQVGQGGGFGVGLVFRWSPEGLLAYGRGESIVTVINPATGEVVVEIETPLNTPAYPMGWTPDGEGLLIKWDMLGDAPGTDEALGLYAGGVLTRLGVVDGTLANIDWAPGDAHALLTVRNPMRTRLYALEANAWTVSALTPAQTNNGRALWSPDGDHLLTYAGAGPASVVYLMSHDGAGRRQVSPPGVSAGFPVWAQTR